MLYYGGVVGDFIGSYVLVNLIVKWRYRSAPGVTGTVVVGWDDSRVVVVVAEVVSGDVVVVTVFRQVAARSPGVPR